MIRAEDRCQAINETHLPVRRLPGPPLHASFWRPRCRQASDLDVPECLTRYRDLVHLERDVAARAREFSLFLHAVKFQLLFDCYLGFNSLIRRKTRLIRQVTNLRRK